MTCGFDKGLLAALYDGEVSPEERAEAERHGATCPECARDLQSMKQLSAALKPLAGATAPLSIAEGVLREIGVGRPVRRRWVQWSGLAAAGLLACVATWYLVDDRSAAPVREVAVDPPAKKPLSNAPLSRRSPVESKAMMEPAPSAARPPAEDHRFARKEKSESEADSYREKNALGEDAAPAPQVPVLLVSSADPRVARRTVEEFLRERRIPADPGPGLLGLGAFVREQFLPVDLSESEVELLKGRLREQLVMAATPADHLEGRGRLGAADRAQKGARPSGDDKDSADAEEFKLKKSPGPPDRDLATGKVAPERKKIVLVFEESPAGAAK